MRVELPAFVVKAMREFVPDGSASVAIIWRSVRLGVECRGLQNTGWEIDVIHLRIVICVHRRRRHAPLAAIDGLANFRELPIELEGGGALDIAQFISPYD